MRIDELLTRPEPTISFEYFPPRDEEGVTKLFDTVETLAPLEPTFSSVTYGAAGSTREGTLEIASKLQNEYGIETMAHLSCVGETVEGLRAILDRIADAGIDNVLALRGDPPRGVEDFEPAPGGLTCAADLIELIEPNYDFALGASCFPEVHPDAASPEADLDYLKRKVDSGASFVISQLFFDNRVFFEWVEKARAAGIDVPIIAGIMPVVSYKQIRRFCEICDADIPEDFAAALEACDGDPDTEQKLGIAYAARQCEELLAAGVAGLHFYTLNRAPATRAIVSALRVARPWERAGGPVPAAG